MNIGDAYRTVHASLAQAGIAEAELKAAHLLAHVLGCRHLELHARFQQTLADDAMEQTLLLSERLEKGEPLQYVMGYTEFMGLRFKTDPRALIPRPETEWLVEAVLQYVNECPVETVLDVGTGSGAIAVALAKLAPPLHLQAVDISSDALKLAAENAKALGVAERIRFQRTNLLEGWAAASVDVIVSNPPYVKTSYWQAHLPVEIRDNEPRVALDGGPDGLVVITRLVQQAMPVLKPGGRLFLEIGEDQGLAVKTLLRETGFAHIQVVKDFAGFERFALGTRP